MRGAIIEYICVIQEGKPLMARVVEWIFKVPVY